MENKENYITVNSEKETKHDDISLDNERTENEQKQRSDIISFQIVSAENKDVIRNYSFSGDGNMEDSIGDTLHVQGPLSYADMLYLKTVTKEMREIDVEIQRAQENGNPELAASMAKRWEMERSNLVTYLKKNNVRICPMKQKNIDKIWDKAEEKEARQTKQKANVHKKTQTKSRGCCRERMRNWD